eukprot:TRINITY_DN19799_c0_g1_i2.p1 TRINITY_DN19799_c0_g1~~TRINITY_DN19799_c0_g1_i2.p1  ORF type:complete len:320 (-),score=66.63 TRINITY_DN19799_c0_g1_i2:124-1083(-)
MFVCCGKADSDRPDDEINLGYTCLHRMSIAMGLMLGPNKLEVGDLLIIDPSSQEFKGGHYPDYVKPGMTVTYLEENANMPRPCHVEMWQGGPRCWMKWEDVRLVQADPKTNAEAYSAEDDQDSDLFEKIVKQSVYMKQSPRDEVEVRLFDTQGEVLRVDCSSCAYSEAKLKIAQHLGITVNEFSLKHSEIGSFEIRDHWQVKQGGCLIVDVNAQLLESARREKAIATAKAAADANGVGQQYTFVSAACEDSGKVKLTYTAVEGDEHITFVHTFVYDPKEKKKPQFQKISKVREIVKLEIRRSHRIPHSHAQTSREWGSG